MSEAAPVCPEGCLLRHCKNGPFVTDSVSGELMCGSCGLVLNERMEDYGSEFHSFSLDDYMHKTRTGMKSSLKFYDMGLSTVIESANRDASGRILSNKMKNEFNRLRIWDSRSKACTRERGMQRAFTNLSSMASKLYLSDAVVEKAAYYYRKIKSKNLLSGNSSDLLICASLYAACRFSGAPRTLNDIAQVANIKKKRIQKNYRKIFQLLDLNLKQFDPVEFVDRISSAVGASGKTRIYAIEILSRARKAEVVAGKNPMGMAAAALYYSAIIHNEPISQHLIADASGVTTVTIRNSCHALVKGIDLYPLPSQTDSNSILN